MDARQIIADLGGYRALADALNLTPTHVHNWTRRGIAARHWPDVVRLAEEQNKTSITFDALRAARPARSAA